MNIGKRFNKYVNSSSHLNVTRSYGFFERFLAMQRAKIANRFICKGNRNGRILDIGCGSYPIFLLTSGFMEKFGIDKTECLKMGVLRRINFINYDVEKGTKLPFDNNYIDVVTILAVIEHIEYLNLRSILSEVYRVLKPGGICVMTVPSPWAEHILGIMANLGLVSKIEMGDHKSRLTNSKIAEFLKSSNFSSINFGYFEFFVNRWFMAKK